MHVKKKILHLSPAFNIILKCKYRSIASRMYMKYQIKSRPTCYAEKCPQWLNTQWGHREQRRHECSLTLCTCYLNSEGNFFCGFEHVNQDVKLTLSMDVHMRPALTCKPAHMQHFQQRHEYLKSIFQHNENSRYRVDMFTAWKIHGHQFSEGVHGGLFEDDQHVTESHVFLSKSGSTL